MRSLIFDLLYSGRLLKLTVNVQDVTGQQENHDNKEPNANAEDGTGRPSDRVNTDGDVEDDGGRLERRANKATTNLNGTAHICRCGAGQQESHTGTQSNDVGNLV